jgi:hypothetical protein
MSETTSTSMGALGPRGKRGAEWRRVPMPMLFLRLDIGRDYTVRREPSFAYSVLTDFYPVGDPLSFEVEFLDEDGSSLACSQLREDCWHCDRSCWPKRIRQPVSYPDGARQLRVQHGPDTIYEESIPEPPTVQVRCSYDNKTGRTRIRWTAAAPETPNDQQAEDGIELWYLVHYRDRGTWRGLGPRTREREAWLDVKMLSLSPTTPIRVLATSGIATGIGECSPETKQPPPPIEGRLVTVNGDPRDGEPMPIPRMLRVHAIDDSGRTLTEADIRWYDESGRELARGRDLDVRRLGPGQHVINAVASQTGGRPIGRTFVIGRAGPGGAPQLHAAYDLQRRADSPAHLHQGGKEGHAS